MMTKRYQMLAAAIEELGGEENLEHY